jgi:hypothetical protein
MSSPSELMMAVAHSSLPYVPSPIVHRSVAVQAEFESKGLKPGFHLIGHLMTPGGFKLWVNCIQLVQPHLSPNAVT